MIINIIIIFIFIIFPIIFIIIVVTIDESVVIFAFVFSILKCIIQLICNIRKVLKHAFFVVYNYNNIATQSTKLTAWLSLQFICCKSFPNFT